MILKFRVYEQTISLQSTKSEPRQGSRDYLELQFSFSSDWNDLLKYVYLQHGEVSVPHDLVEGSVIVDEYFTEQTEFNVTLFGRSADGSVEVPTNVVTVFLKESNNLWVKDAPKPQNSWFVQVVDARDEALAAAIRAENAAIRQPYPSAETGTWWVWDAEAGTYKDSGESYGGSGGTSDHTQLSNRNAADQHPMSAITGLEQALEGKQQAGNYITKELDPTVPAWAKQPQKPAYTAQEVGALPDTTHIPSTAADVNAEPYGAVSQHNVSDASHSDIRLLIQGLSERLSAVADSDDTTLDQLSEVVAYIKSNRDLISSITTDKVSVADIVDNLTTNVANKPLSAAQGVALKALIDAITIPGALPNPNALTFTGAVTGSYDGSEPLTVNIPSSEGGSGVSGDLPNWRRIKTLEFSSEIEYITFSEDDNGEAFAVKEIMIVGTFPGLESTGYLYCGIGRGATNALWPTAGKEMRWWLASVDGALKTMLAVSGTAVTGPTDRNTSCPSDLVTICVGASKAFAADGTLYVYGR